MKKVGIAIDNWKLPIFKKHLDDAGYLFTQHPGVTPDTLLLTVRCEFASKLQTVVEAAQKECAENCVRCMTCGASGPIDGTERICECPDSAH